MTNRRFFIFANGDFRDPDFYRKQIDAEDRIVCVDGGARHVLEMGLHPHVVVGDTDSIDADLRQRLNNMSVEWIRDPSIDQDKSDMEMALDHVLSLRPKPLEIVVCGALGGKRVDHTLINLFLLLRPFEAGVRARIIDELQTIRLIDGELKFQGQVGDYLSLFALTPSVTGIWTRGLKYPLHGDTLYFASTLGLSNELSSLEAEVTFSSGLLLAVHISRH